MNYQCGKNVVVGNPTMTTGGNLHANQNVLVNGKVGIGTSSPTCKLQINDNNKADVCVYTTSNNKSEIWTMNALYAYGLGVDNTGKGHLYAYFNTPKDIMVFDGQGRVIIGNQQVVGTHSQTLFYK